ncbi:restriction endonuclease subunit S [Enterococcus faecalis]|uniref:restriction endonuclease subunit S n=1 Tax=Enterococcus faecalis TaxID=1351 RepID=UPI0019F0B0F1|nr:restriction endonuclease subunit S [Enterococcus faecalis]EGO6563489.1 restriction endonuclease subunit S [Enterococcus faecalis]EGS7968352.1 restriction endonuclease subunit S [Enterococcus faecalis]MDV7825800.1 restriction endonuclease subunit S [Enterococcus faecalis]MDV7839139.1 restriction endonuclease subunit S [Enterococcus faecalis]HAP3790264.1 restriction endonuclease subunit S [Enterococcus faecalis]
MKKVPRLRFRGFSEDWELCKLGQVANYRRGSFPQPYGNKEWYDGENSMPFVQVVDVGDNLRLVEDTKQKISELAQPKSVFVKEGKVVVTLQGSIGRVAITQYPAYVDRTLLIFESYKAEMDEYYFAYVIQQLFEYEKTRAPGGTIKTVTKEALSDFTISFPSIEEQKKLGKFFEQLDDTITLHQRKSDQLKELKKAYLQLMFPTKEERVPKLRFAAFEGEWAHRKLGEITESFSGGTPTAGKSEYYGGDIPFIRSGEISSDSTELFITENGLNSSSAKMVKVGDILYALYGATSGEVGISKITGAINQAILAIRPSKNDNSYLIIQWLRKQKNTIISTYLQGGQGNLSSSIVKNLIIMLPQNKEEQEKVGMFFKQLDNIITLHQNKLEQLKDLKTSYLQNMFI